MKKTNIEFKAKEYLFHLNNANDENGIKPDEGWKFTHVDLSGRQAIEHSYYPVLSIEVGVAEMDTFSDLIVRGLKTDHPKIHAGDLKAEDSVGAAHFVAFCPSRPKR